MGKNKEQLKEHNLDLFAILSGIQNLPPAGGEDLQGTVEEQTTAVNNLLKMVSRKVAEKNGVDLMTLFGYTKMAVDTLTYTTDTYPSNGLKHTLGEIPQLAILIGEVDTVANCVFFGIVGYGGSGNSASYSALAFHLSYKQTIAGSITHPSKTTVYLYDYGKTKFLKAGKEYTLITFA